MITEETLVEAAAIILERILTPVLYLYQEEALEFICFPDANTEEEDFLETQAALYLNLGINAEIVDIRAFDAPDRVTITKTAQLVYAESEFIQTMFEMAMQTDEAKLELGKLETLDRKNETGTYFAC